MTPALAAIWRRMPAAARARVESVLELYRPLLIELWPVAEENDRYPELPREDTLTSLVMAALGGKVGSDDNERRHIQQLIEGRVSEMRRLYGYQTLSALNAERPDVYARFMAGSVRALNRVRLIRDGDITPRQHYEMRRREQDRRRAVEYGEFDRALEEARP